MNRFWLWVLARFYLNDNVVCQLSVGRGLHNDYHDYQDSIAGTPWHFVILRCKRCGKEFVI